MIDPKGRNSRETLVFVALGIAVFAVLSQLEAFEWFVEFSQRHEAFQIDELVLLFAVAGVLFPVVLWRRGVALQRLYLDHVKVQQELRALAEFDTLTGLGNRARFKQDLFEHVQRSRGPETCVHLLKVDLDDFKQINDLYGLPAGDVLLGRIADRLKSICGKSDLPNRVGGDEFGVLVFGTRRQARDLADQILTRMREPFEFDNWHAEVTVSIGISSWTPEAKPATILSQADQAMFWAKESGRDQCVEYVRSIGDETRKAARFRAELTRAVEEDVITSHFQPIVDLASGRLLGFEALARWHHADFGQVPPDKFISLAEDIGLIDRLSDQLFRRCCAVMQCWPTHINLSFNLSPYQLSESDGRAPLEQRLTTILNDAGIAPSRIELEITEHAVISDIDRARRVVANLKGQGMRLSLDDFGTGTSSLSTLSQLPFDNIKLDRSFVSGSPREPKLGKIVEAVLGLARSMDMTVTAEGIETNEELSFLRDYECAKGQGYLLGRPMAEGQLEQVLTWDAAIWDSAHHDEARRTG